MDRQADDLIQQLACVRDRARRLTEQSERYGFFSIPSSLRREIEQVFEELVYIISELHDPTEGQIQVLSERLKATLHHLDHVRTELTISASPIRRLRIRSELRGISHEIERITSELSRLAELGVQMEVDRANTFLARGDLEASAQLLQQLLEVDDMNQEARSLYASVARAFRMREEHSHATELYETAMRSLERADFDLAMYHSDQLAGRRHAGWFPDLYEKAERLRHETMEMQAEYSQATRFLEDAITSVERADLEMAMHLLDRLKSLRVTERAPDLQHRLMQVEYEMDQRLTRLRDASLLSLYSIARVHLNEGELAVVGRVYSMSVGIAWSQPEGFQGEPFDLLIRNVRESVPFDIILHPGENVQLIGDWHRQLVYELLQTRPQLVDCEFKITGPGPSVISVDFYHQRRWLATIRLEFESVQALQFATLSA